ncbi:MAG: baseplate J/gp47 family protein [Planctomycetota bacterium]
MSDHLAIDYTNKDYSSLRAALLRLARYRLPEWTDHSPADLGVVLVDLFAYMGDVILYYQDRIANESFLATAQERASVMHLLRQIGYEMKRPVPATTELELTFTPPGGPAVVAIPHGTAFRATQPSDARPYFEYMGPDLTVDLNSDQVRPQDGSANVTYALPVHQSRTVPTEVLGSSTGEANQRFRLTQAPAILESIAVEVDEGAGWVRWDRRESLLYQVDRDGRVAVSAADARDCYCQYDEDGNAWVHFGDGEYGRRPPLGTNNIRVTYRVGGGSVGNVPPGSITESVAAIANLTAVSNPLSAAGGEDEQSTADAARLGPQVFRSTERAVTVQDYVALAYQAGGVEKARARALGWNRIQLYVAATGSSCGPVPEGLRRQLLAWFEDRRMAGTFVEIMDPTCVAIDVTIAVTIDPHFQPESVRQQVADAAHAILAYANTSFGQVLSQAEPLAAARAVAGVVAADILHFRRNDEAIDQRQWDDRLSDASLPEFSGLPDFLQEALLSQRRTNERIELGEFEIPVSGTIEVEVEVKQP